MSDAHRTQLQRLADVVHLLLDPVDRDDAIARIDQVAAELIAADLLLATDRPAGDPLTVDCGACRAKAGTPCRRYDGTPRAKAHKERIANARGEAHERPPARRSTHLPPGMGDRALYRRDTRHPTTKPDRSTTHARHRNPAG